MLTERQWRQKEIRRGISDAAAGGLLIGSEEFTHLVGGKVKAVSIAAEAEDLKAEVELLRRQVRQKKIN